jgi:hypothetical protein
MKFPEKQAREWAAHVGRCDEAEARVMAAEERRQSSGFKRMLDREQFAFLRERAIEKGEIKP